MLGLPPNTEISKQLPKKAIFAKFELKPAQRDHFDADISRMQLVNAISPSTIPALQKGNDVECIYVIDVILKKPDYDPKNILLLNKLIPQKMIFALHYEDNVQLTIFHSKLICGPWQKKDSVVLNLQGLDLDKVWENLVMTIGDIVLEDDHTLQEQIDTDEAKAKLLKEIERLEKKARNEKQQWKKLELFEEIKRLKNKIEL